MTRQFKPLTGGPAGVDRSSRPHHAPLGVPVQVRGCGAGVLVLHVSAGPELGQLIGVVRDGLAGKVYWTALSGPCLPP